MAHLHGTFLTEAKAALDPSGHERVAIQENGPTNCARVLVIDADTCVNNSCLILNGAGNPGGSPTWLPDGRVAAAGVTAPNRKGRCPGTGSIVTINPNDTTGTSTNLIAVGEEAEGSGGG
jgi:hypothetical protein